MVSVLVVGERNEDFHKWLSSILSKEFVVERLCVQSSSENIPFFLARWVTVIKKWRKALKNFNPDKVLIYGEELISIWIIVFLIRLFRLKIEIILFRYDIEHFRQFSKEFKMTFGHYITRKLEKFCFLKADKIIHKGLENELEFLPFYKKIKNKPHYLFREFLNPKLIQKYIPKKKLSAKDGKFHLVIVGFSSLKTSPYAESIFDFYPKISHQKFHLHIYSKLDKKTEKKLREIEANDPYFHYHGLFPHNVLIKELSKYDYGLYMPLSNVEKIKNNYHVICSFGNKIFDYISAHLPIICSDDATATVKFIDEYKVGFHLNDLDSLKDTLIKNKKGYTQLIKNIDKGIPRFLDYTNFINFIKNEPINPLSSIRTADYVKARTLN